MDPKDLEALEAKIMEDNKQRNLAHFAGREQAKEWAKSKPYGWTLAKEAYPDEADKELRRYFEDGFSSYFQETIESASQAFSEVLNHMGAEQQKLAEALFNDHPTLQQEKMKVFLRFIKLMAEAYNPNWSDARNEDSIKAARKIMDALGPDFWYNGTPALRFI